ncbi:MAG: insulinase family protein [Oscillospiraceae bacterium]|nr:insulinase family protein [Oscillospiraceae bacterium]
MSDTIKRKKIGDGVFFSAITDPKFKSNRISVNLLLPLEEAAAANRAIVPFILRLRNRDCPDFTRLNEKLCDLYGALVDGDVRKYGAYQIINLSVQSLDDRYSIDGAPLVQECADLACKMLFDPYLEGGLFSEADVRLERQNLIDTIESEFNDKREYAVNKCVSLMFGDSPLAVKKYGARERAEQITAQSATDAYRDLLRRAAVEILFIGCGDPSAAETVFSKRFSDLVRAPIAYDPSLPVSRAQQVQSVREDMDITQGKLVMGFRTGQTTSPDEVNAMKMMVALYGGTPFSRLFKNVREKLSLCYYCTSRYDKASGMVMVDSGVETGNEQKAEEEILRQLELVRQGEFDEEEISSTILTITNALKSTVDTLNGLENWYLTQILSGCDESPLENVEKVSRVTKQQIQAAAAQVTLDTVFFLGAKKEGESR